MSGTENEGDPNHKTFQGKENVREGCAGNEITVTIFHTPFSFFFFFAGRGGIINSFFFTSGSLQIPPGGTPS